MGGIHDYLRAVRLLNKTGEAQEDRTVLEIEIHELGCKTPAMMQTMPTKDPSFSRNLSSAFNHYPLTVFSFLFALLFFTLRRQLGFSPSCFLVSPLLSVVDSSLIPSLSPNQLFFPAVNLTLFPSPRSACSPKPLCILSSFWSFFSFVFLKLILSPSWFFFSIFQPSLFIPKKPLLRLPFLLLFIPGILYPKTLKHSSIFCR